MAKKRLLPKKLFVRWNTFIDEPFLEAQTKANDLAEFEETIEVGVYELKQTTKLKNTTMVD